MASLKLILGMIPATSKIEQEEKALITEYEKLKIFSESDQLAKYDKLNELVNSQKFTQERKDIKSLQYKNSIEYSREKEFITLQKARDIVLYFKTMSGSALKRDSEMEDSDKRTEYEALEKIIRSSEFKGKTKVKKFKETEDYKKLQRYNQLKGSSEIKNFYKFKASKEYSNYLNINGSTRLARYNELKGLIASTEFIEEKNYLLDKKRFEKTEMYKEVQEYEKIKKSDDIIWYFKVKDSEKFNMLKSRELTFSDEFDGEKLDTKRWLTNYYWGEKLLKDRYSVESDLQAYTEKENFDLRNSILKINTKPQKIAGKVWSAKNGFSTKDFNYSSGLINTGNSFRQKYGIFTAKIKLGDPQAKSAFFMLADKITPHIDICHTGKGKVWIDLFNNGNTTAKTSIGGRYANDYFIYSLEWTSDKLIWKINGIETFRQTSGIPQEPMYVLFAGGLDKPINGMTSMEIDWVRVYKTVF